MALSERDSLKVYDTKMRLLAKAGYCCEFCGRRMEPGEVQLAHRISQKYKEQYGEDVIHHDQNLMVVCSLSCNSAVDLGDSKEGHAEVLSDILMDQSKDWYDG